MLAGVPVAIVPQVPRRNPPLQVLKEQPHQLSRHRAFPLYCDDDVVLFTQDQAPVISRDKGTLLGAGFLNQQMYNNSVWHSVSFPKYLSKFNEVLI